MEQGEDPSLSEYISLVWKKKWLFLIVACLVFAIGIFAILTIPIIYRSTGIVQVEQQEIPEQWVNSTVSTAAADRIQAIGQRVLTTSNLSAIIKKFDLRSSYSNSATLDELIAETRSNFSVEPIQSSSQRGVIAFRISYDSESPEVALNVANELVDLYLTENLRSRKQSVTDTRRFLEEEADRIELQLAEIEDKISSFKKNHQGALPEFQNVNLSAYERVEQQIGTIDRTLQSLEERRTVLEASLDSTLRLLTIDSNDLTSQTETDPVVARLQELRPEYVRLKTRYSEAHPDVVKIVREISSLEQQIAEKQEEETSEEDGNTVAPLEDTTLIRLRNDLNAALIEQRSLRQRRGELVTKLDELEKKINKSPEVEQEYRALNRDYENLQTKYNDIRNKQNSARVSESLEAEQKSERFTLIEPPRLATFPHSPNHKKMFLLAVGAAFISGLGSVLGLNFIDSRVRNISSVGAITKVPVLTTVGYIESPIDRRRRIRNFILIILTIAVIVALAVYFYDKYPIPVNEIFPEQVVSNAEKILEKYGLLK